MSPNFTFKWPKGPEEVIITGTFDNWSKTLPMVKNSDGSFELTMPLPASDEKILYKYVVDGEWKVSTAERIGKDDSGIDNNILEASDLVTASEGKGSKIPEAGGLVSASGNAPKSDELKTTVLPKEELSYPSLSGEPGVVIPKNSEAISAFSEIREVDPKSLNEPELSAAKKKKLKKKVKRSQYRAKKKKKTPENGQGTDGENLSGGAVAPVTSTTEASEQDTTENEAATPEPTTQQSEDGDKEDKDIGSAAPIAAAAAAGASVGAASTIPLTDEVKADAPVADTSKVLEEPVVTGATSEQDIVPEADAEEAEREVSTKDDKETLKESLDKGPVPVADTEPQELESEPAGVEKSAATTEDAKPSEVIHSTLDPKASQPIDTKVADEVAPEKVPEETKEKKAVLTEGESEEIVVSQGNDPNVEAAIVAQEGDVEVEEIKPTKSEIEQIKADSQLPPNIKDGLEKSSQTTNEATKEGVKSEAPKETEQPKEKEEPKKKKSGLSRFLKKLFK